MVMAYNLVGSVESNTASYILAAIPATPSLAPIEVAVTDSSISVRITELTATAETGGATILSYNLQMDDGTGADNFNDVFGGSINDQSMPDTLLTSYTAYNLTRSKSYKFRYRAKNIYGYSSSWSPMLTSLVAVVPT